MPYIGNIVQDFSVNNAMLNTDSVTSIKIDDGTIVNADINDSAAIAMSKLALSITNSEINASAAIAGTKISTNFGTQDLLINGKISLDASKELGVFEADTSLGFTNSAKLSFDFSSNLARIRSSGNGSFSARPLTFNIVNTEAMRIDTSGRLLVAATSSSQADSTADDLVLGNTSQGNNGMTIVTNNANNGVLFFADQDASVQGGIRYQHGADVAQFYAGGNVVLNLKNKGVGINETSPAADALTIRGGDTDDTPRLILKRATDGIQVDGEIIGKLQFMSNENNVDSGNYQPRAEIHGVTVNTAGAAKLDFYTVGNSTTTPTKAMTLNQEGRLCIGTADANARLNVVAASSSTDATSATSLAAYISASNTNTTNNNFTGIIFGDRTDSLDFVTGMLCQITDHTNNYGNLQFFTNSSGGRTEKLRITSGGNVGIGTSSPTSKLNVAGRLDVDGLQNQNTAEIFANSTSGQSFGLLVNGGSTSGDYCANFRDKDAGNIMILRGDGKVGIGTSTPSVKLSVTSSNASGGDIVSFQNSVVNHYGGVVIMGGQNDRECRFNAAFGNGYMTFYPMPNSGAGSEHMRIRHGGVCMGRTTLTSFTAALHVSATAGGGIAIATHADTTCMFFNRTDNNAAYVAMRFYVQGSQKGFIQVNTGSVTYSTSSDYRLKENVVSISDGITRLKKLKPYRFNFKEDTSKTLDGFFAHEASEVVPEAVVGEKDAIKDGKIDPQGIDQSKLVPLLTAALQEAITKIETLETKVAALEAA